MAATELLAAAMAHLRAGAWQDAETSARAALADDPADLNAVLLLGLAVAAMGEASRAAPALARVAAERPDAAHPCSDLVSMQPALPRALVARQFRACLRLAPSDDRLRLAFADLLLDNDQAPEAGDVLSDAPDTAPAHHLRGLAHAECNRFAAAIASFEAAVARDPGAAASWSNLGMVLKIEGRFAEAIAAHDRAVALAPGNARFRVNRAVALLKAGSWERAWADYEARLDLTEAAPVDKAKLLPSLRPGDSLNGVTVVALHEDGFGDTLQFLRYLPLLAGCGARVIACVPPALARLMRRVPGVSAVTADPRTLPPHDFVCPMFSLPRVFASTVRDVPPVPLLAPDTAPVSRRVPTGGLRVGLVWAGQARPALPGFRTLDRRRSAGLAAFAPLAGVPGVRLVSLQTGPAARQHRPPGMTLFDPMQDVTDFADTAAIIEGLDVVVSVDTSVVHLAGLVRKPVFLLDRYDGCWRWLSGRRDSPWYPDLTIFRQPAPGDWASAVRAAAASLHAMALYRGAGLVRPSVVREPAFVA
jgi:tetratricopeptide (TPR) repeat protein